MHTAPFLWITLNILLVSLSVLPTHYCTRLWRIDPRILWELQRSSEITPLSVLNDRFFFLKGFGFNGISNFMFQRAPALYLPTVDVSLEFDLEPDLIAYDPSFIKFPPPPQIPASDGYKTQFVCDYEYDPAEDTESEALYNDYCFYYLYTPK